MKNPHACQAEYPVDPSAWAKHMQRIRQLSPYQQALIDPDLLREALNDNRSR